MAQQDFVSGLFGPSPEQIRQAQYAQDAERAAQLAQMSAVQRGTAGLMTGGAGLARMGAQAAGWKDPQVEQAKARQMAMSQGIDLNDPKSIRAAALRLREAEPQIAMRLGLLANEREKDQSEIERNLRNNPNITIEEISVGDGMFQEIAVDKTGQVPDRMLGKPYKGARREKGGALGSSRAFVVTNPETGEQRVVDMPTADALTKEGWEVIQYSAATAAGMSRGKEYGKGGAESMQADYNAFRAAETTIPKLEGVIKLIKNGNVVTGPAANLRLGLQKARQFFLDSKAANANVTDTQVLNALLGSDVFGMIQSLGIGARGMDTPAEREFLREVMTGTIELNDQALIRMAEIRLEQQKKAKDRWLKKSKSQRGAFKRDFLGDVEATEAGSDGSELPAGFTLD